MMPKQKPGLSKQTYQTPPEFIAAVKQRLAIKAFACDLAADKDNTVAPMFYSEENSAFDHSWYMGSGWNWCNPPYSNIRPWVEKAYLEMIQRGTQTVMLVPASTGANWWRDYVDGKAHVLLLNGRLTFVGETTPYIKDCALLGYAPYCEGGYTVWDWA